MQGARPNLGSGYSIAPQDVPQPVGVTYSSFLAGIVSSDSAEDIPKDAAQFAVDMEVSRADGLIRAPGILQLYNNAPRSLQYLFVHPGLDYNAELVCIDPPYLGYQATAGMTFVNLGIGATQGEPWNALAVEGELIFSNGVDKTYVRDTEAVTITDITARIIAARTFASVFGRVFAGGVTPAAGLYQPLGISWTGSSGSVSDWLGTNSGSELLISDEGKVDKVVSLRSIGFDLLGILQRNSLWLGYPTGTANRPADFRPRVQSIGCVSDATACATPAGITFLSDEGVMNFNPNLEEIISDPINGDLLPLDYTQLSKYSAVFEQERMRYVLRTPSGIWIYTFPRGGIKGRWTFRSAIVDSLIGFTDQSGLIRWDDMPTSWDLQSGTWADLVQTQSNAQSRLYFGKAGLLGVESASTESYFGTAFTSIWQTGFAVTDDVTAQAFTVGFELSYKSFAPSVIRLTLPDSLGDFSGETVTKTLPSTNGRTARVNVHLLGMGMSAAVEIAILSGLPAIARVRQLMQEGGSAINAEVP